jgi:hypothetical protein
VDRRRKLPTYRFGRFLSLHSRRDGRPADTTDPVAAAAVVVAVVAVVAVAAVAAAAVVVALEITADSLAVAVAVGGVVAAGAADVGDGD